MKTSLRLATILFIVALGAPGAFAQQMTAFQCIATAVAPGATQATIYVSQLIPLEASERVALTGAWNKFVRDNYHLDSVASAVCSPLGSDAAIQQRVLASEANAWQKNGLKVVQVNWRPGQSPAPAPAPAAAAPPPAPSAPTPPANQGPPPRASYCYSDDRKPTVYFSDPFDTADLPSSSGWSAAFAKFLAQKYAYKGTVTCKDKDTIVSVQSAILEQKDALQGKQTVDTDWTYEPPAPGDSAAADAAPAAPPKTHGSH
jgi:hypothetical protein